MSLLSPYWYRVAGLKPSLRSHVRILRHRYRGQTWYVLQDPSSSRQHRFSHSVHHIIGLMDGQRTVHQIWDAAITSLADEAPTQDEIIGLLNRLHTADVLQSDVPADSLEMFQRQTRKRGAWKRGLANPLALRFPLVDPDFFLCNWLSLVKPLAGRVGFVLWLVVVGTACVQAAFNWPALTHNLADRVLQPHNLLLLWLIYPLVKLLHELGHAFATRIWGGEVHEMGIMLLALMPIPYVEASASASFPDKRQRMAVAGAGIAVELFIASLALFLWLNVESGRISAIAYNVMLVGGLSTVLFNGNPLLRFDGYFILADWIEIPNLGQRSTGYLGYLAQRYLFGIEEAVSPVTAPGERAWFIGYGLASFAYRLFTMAMLALFVSSKFFTVGVLIALWALATQIVAPTVRSCVRLHARAGDRGQRARLYTVGGVLGGVLALLFFVIPFPLATQCEGVVSLAEHSRIRAGADCFITEILARDGSEIESGEPLIACEDPYLETEVRLLEANLAEIRARSLAESLQSRKNREILMEEIAAAEAQLARAHERREDLLISSPNQGLLTLPESSSLAGRFVEQGALLGYVMGPAQSVVVAVIGQSDISLVREKTTKVELRLAGDIGVLRTATIDRETPAASDTLPSPVLGLSGGGDVPVDPADSTGVRALNKVFQVEIKLPIPKERIRIGERAYIRFDHGYEPLGLQWYRSLRQLFLRQLHA